MLHKTLFRVRILCYELDLSAVDTFESCIYETEKMNHLFFGSTTEMELSNEQY